jgi:hypothetical protein
MTTLEDYFRGMLRDVVREELRSLHAPTSDDAPEFMLVKEAAKFARRHPATIRAALNSGRLRRYGSRRKPTVRRDELIAFLGSNQSDPSEKLDAESIAETILKGRD